ncbi:MAG: hypothetical protein QF815_03040, partial [Candidatus Peribacteraceae bacterium]|nr:hypothetical protein [Candidatus Peribacteraceae bacterium]
IYQSLRTHVVAHLTLVVESAPERTMSAELLLTMMARNTAHVFGSHKERAEVYLMLVVEDAQKQRLV